MIDKRIEKYLTEAKKAISFPETERLYDEKWRLLDKFQKDIDATKNKYSIAMKQACTKELKAFFKKTGEIDEELNSKIEEEIFALFEDDRNDAQYDIIELLQELSGIESVY